MQLVKQSAVLFVDGTNNPDAFIERVGRVCYKSEDAITPESSKKFVETLVKRGHTSVLEHATFYFEVSEALYAKLKELNARHMVMSAVRGVYLVTLNARALREMWNYNPSLFNDLVAVAREKAPALLGDLQVMSIADLEVKSVLTTPWDFYNRYGSHLAFSDIEKHVRLTYHIICDRGISHELVRHRVASFTQESTRYVNYNKKGIQIVDPEGDITGMKLFFWRFFTKIAGLGYSLMIKMGLPPQFSRDLLPHNVKTELYMTASVADWNHFLSLRLAEGAHPRARRVARDIAGTLTSRLV